MSIRPLRRVTVYGTRADKAAALDELQSLGCVHLESLGDGQVELETSQNLRARFRKALQYLQTCPNKKRPVREATGFDPESIEEEITHVRRLSRELQDEQDLLLERIEAIEPWGDFAFPPRAELGGWRLWFYEVPHYLMRRVEQTGLVWQVIRRSPRHAYVAVVSEMEPKGMPVRRTRTGGRSLSDLLDRLDVVETELERLAARRWQLTRWIALLESYINEVEDRAERLRAEAQALDAPHAFALRGWAPADEVDAIVATCRQAGLAVVTEEPDADDLPPTLLQNPPLLAGGAQLVQLYRTPAYRSWDPSIIVFFSFVAFFAMILSDAGYGLLLLAGVGLWWGRMGRASEGVRTMRPLFLALSLATTAYGVLVGSYFGWTPPAGSPLARLHVLELTNFDAMMHLSVLIGVAHLVLGNVIAGARAWPSPTALKSFGWVLVILGALALYENAQVSSPPAWLRLVALEVLGSGLVAVLLFASERPWRPVRAGRLALRLLDGALSLTDVSKAFGDVLSYLRLFALGLSSAFLAITFNDMAREVATSFPGLGLAGAILLLLIGHALNLGLCIMGGVVHGLRLNYIEFFNWCLTEDGHPFRPFRRKAA